jgi:Predicted membrane protein (DUF2207) C-terminal domain
VNINLNGNIALLFLVAVVTLPALVVMALYAITSSRYRKHLFKSGQAVIAEYNAPDNLTPAELGYLFHFKSNVTEIYGTAFDLERRGYVTVNRTSEGLQITTTNSDPTALKGHEVMLISAFKNSGVLAPAYTRELLLPFSQSVRMQLEQSGYLKGSIFIHYIRATVVSILLMDLVFPGVLLLISRSLSVIGVVIFFVFTFGIFVYAPAALFLAWLYTALAGHAWMGSVKMKTLWPEILGFRSYIKLAELGQIKYNSEDLRLSCTNYAFPYAVALGFNTNWQKPVA